MADPRKKFKTTRTYSEDFTKTLINSIPDAVVQFNAEGKILYCEKCPILGLDSARIRGKKIQEIFPDGIAGQFMRYLDLAQKTKKTQVFEFQLLNNSDPEEFETRLSFCDEHTVIAIIRNITSHKQFEFEIEKSEKKFRILLESAAQAIVIVNIHGQITLMNAKADELFGYERDELIDQSIEILVPNRLRSKHIRHRSEFLTRPQTRPMGAGMELMALHKDGSEFPIEVGLSSIEIYEGAFVMAFITDISERKELEKKLRQVEKLEAIGQLAGGVAHDFNNVLAGIIGLSELGLRKIDHGETAQENIKLIIDKAQSAANLVRQLMTFSRKQIVALHQIDLNKAIGGNIKLLQRYLGEEIHLSASLADGLFAIEADESAIDQIITNLAINARDAMPDGGDIQIRTENMTLNSAMFTDMGELQAGDYIKLSVIDTGIGMSNEVRKHIFEPFFTTKDIGSGTGLGLSIVYGLVNQLNGMMNCKSRLGEGTAFEIYLPGSRKSNSADRTEKDPKVKHGNETILLVENEAELLTTFKSTLESYGYKVIIASNGLTALKIYEKNYPNIDLIVSDVVMPKMGGIELKIVAQRINPDLKILFISAYSDKLEPDVPLLQKPFRAKELATKVREILDLKSRLI